MKLELKPKSWKNLFENIREDAPKEPKGNFWATIQRLEDQYEEQGGNKQ